MVVDSTRTARVPLWLKSQTGDVESPPPPSCSCKERERETAPPMTTTTTSNTLKISCRIAARTALIRILLRSGQPRFPNNEVNVVRTSIPSGFLSSSVRPDHHQDCTSVSCSLSTGDCFNIIIILRTVLSSGRPIHSDTGFDTQPTRRERRPIHVPPTQRVVSDKQYSLSLGCRRSCHETERK